MNKNTISEESYNEIKDLFQSLFVNDLSGKFEEVIDKVENQENELVKMSQQCSKIDGVNVELFELQSKIKCLSGDWSDETLEEVLKKIIDGINKMYTIVVNLEDEIQKMPRQFRDNKILGNKNKDDVDMKKLEKKMLSIEAEVNRKKEELEGLINDNTGQLIEKIESIAQKDVSYMAVGSQLEYPEYIEEEGNTEEERLEDIALMQKELRKQLASFSKIYDALKKSLAAVIEERIALQTETLINNDKKIMEKLWLAIGLLFAGNVSVIFMMLM